MNRTLARAASFAALALAVLPALMLALYVSSPSFFG